MTVRSQARALVLQCLYELDFTDHTFEHALSAHVEGTIVDDGEPNYGLGLSPKGIKFARTLGTAVEKRLEELDTLAAKYAPEWPFDQISAIDRNILRLAICELLFTKDAPGKVVINEAVELAKQFGRDTSPRFVNGVLGAVISHRESHEKSAA